MERLSSLDTRFTDQKDVIQHNLPLVGGFSGAPIINMQGQLVGITTESSFRVIKADEITSKRIGDIGKGPIRLIDAANINFAIGASHLNDWLGALRIGESP